MSDVNVFVAFAAGIFSFLSPCVLPLIPSYLSFISGVSLEDMRHDQTLKRLRARVVLKHGRWRCKQCDRPVRLREGEVAMRVPA